MNAGTKDSVLRHDGSSFPPAHPHLFRNFLKSRPPASSQMAVVFLQTADLEAAELQLVAYTFQCGERPFDRRGDGNAGRHGAGPHLHLVEHGVGPGLGGVDDPLDFTVADQVKQIGPST